MTIQLLNIMMNTSLARQCRALTAPFFYFIQFCHVTLITQDIDIQRWQVANPFGCRGSSRPQHTYRNLQAAMRFFASFLFACAVLGVVTGKKEKGKGGKRDVDRPDLPNCALA